MISTSRGNNPTENQGIGRAMKMTVDEFKKMQLSNKPKGYKYRNIPTTRIVGDNIIKFSSKKEAERFDTLRLMLRAGDIVDLKLQPQFTLQESYITAEGERIQAIRYTADFSYKKYVATIFGRDDLFVDVVEDVKSEITRKNKVYVMKKKLMQEKFGINLVEA